MLFLILEWIEMPSFVHYRAEYVPVLLIIVKFDVDLEWTDVPFGIFYEQLLHPLNEHWNTSLSEDLQKSVMMLGYYLWHYHIDRFAVCVYLVRCVAEHVAQLSIGVDDLPKLMKGAFNEQKTGFIHILVECVFVLIVLDGLVHRLNLLHLEHVLVVLIR
jgi:hypothetical protein